MSAQTRFNSCIFSHTWDRPRALIQSTIASRLAQSNAAAVSRQHWEKSLYVLRWCGCTASSSFFPPSTENQGSHSPTSSPHHHRLLPSEWNLRSQQPRQAPGTNVEMSLRSHWATTVNDSQIWCEPFHWLSGRMNTCRRNSEVACPHDRLLLQFQSWPWGSNSRTAENKYRLRLETMQIAPNDSRPSGAEVLLFCLAPAQARYGSEAGDSPHPHETNSRSPFPTWGREKSPPYSLLRKPPAEPRTPRAGGLVP